MKVAIFSDLQGFSQKSWSNLIKQGLPEVDCVITLGDIDGFYLKKLKAMTLDNVPWIGVHGNHDSFVSLENTGIKNFHNNTDKVGDFLFGGLEGSLRYKKGNFPMYTQTEASFYLNNMDQCDIFISHNSPFGIHDKKDSVHDGFIGLLEYIQKHRPKYVFHGHQHLNKETIVGNTKVIGIYGGWIFDLSTGSKYEVLTMN